MQLSERRCIILSNNVPDIFLVPDQNVPAVAVTAVDLVLVAVDLTTVRDKEQDV